MPDPDFAFFSLRPFDKRGLVYRKYLLDRLAPFLFTPRVAAMIELPAINARGYHILLPLGAGNLDQMEPERREQILGRSLEVVKDFRLSGLAVDRLLKGQYHATLNGLKTVFGDHFIKALALAFIKRILGRHGVKRVIIATDHEDLAAFIDYMPRLGVPLSVQSYHPARYEPIAYQMMYEKGLAVSTSLFNPHSWEKGDLVVVFDPRDRFIALSHQSMFFLQLGNKSCNLAPDLEVSLGSYGIKSGLHSLAPILELCLMPAATGLSPLNGGYGIDHPQAFVALEEAASSRGLWDLFLDKAR